MAIKSKKSWSKKQYAQAIATLIINTLLILACMFIAFVFRIGGFSNLYMNVLGNIKMIAFIVFSVVLVSVGIFLFFYYQNKDFISKSKNITMIYMVVLISLIACYAFGKISMYLRPMVLCAVLILVLSNKRTAVFMNGAFSILMLLMDLLCASFHGSGNYALISLIMTFASGIIAVFLIDGEGSRAKVLFMGFVMSLPIIASAVIVEYSRSDILKMAIPALYALGSGLLSVSLMTVLLPIFERAFGALTNFRLTELTDHKSRLIKELSISAPGTFSHTIIVAMLAEACGNAIGENPLVVRACAYYHDIGKLKNPDYFTENQSGKNPHDELSPELSTDIIRSHAKDGGEFIRKRRLPEIFAEAAEQHHGTLPIRYFYMKASKFTDGKLSLDNFSYYGPKPQTKVNAIIMICDACEAKVRTISNRTHENVDKAVKEIIEERMELDQFNECDITFKELDIIRNTITNTLSGVYHERVRYPKLKIGGKRG